MLILAMMAMIGGRAFFSVPVEAPRPTSSVGKWLQTLHMFPVRQAVVVPAVQPPIRTLAKPVPPPKQIKNPLRSWHGGKVIAFRSLAICAAAAALYYATSRLDVLAHAAQAVITKPSGSCVAVASAGVAAGALHTLSGPDHLAALAPLAMGNRNRGMAAAFRTGVLWGSGHVLGQTLLGLTMLGLASCGVAPLTARLGLDAIAEQAATAAVGIVLVAIGWMGFKEASEWQDEGDGDQAQLFTWRTFGTGILSGMHPDALLFCLPALALPLLKGAAFLSSFALGTLLSMGAFTTVLHRACCALGPKAVKNVSFISSGVAITVGVAVCGVALGLPFL